MREKVSVCINAVSPLLLCAIIKLVQLRKDLHLKIAGRSSHGNVFRDEQ